MFFLTGRPAEQFPGTRPNLAKVGYGSIPADRLFMKKASHSWLVGCPASCTPTEYKALSRQHTQLMGCEIVANFGDQYSDLNGGFADRAFKIPNPMYFIQ